MLILDFKGVFTSFRLEVPGRGSLLVSRELWKVNLDAEEFGIVPAAIRVVGVGYKLERLGLARRTIYARGLLLDRSLSSRGSNR